MVSRLGAPPGEIEVLFVDGDRGPAERETGGCNELPHLPVRMTKEEDAGGLRADRRLAGGKLCNQCGKSPVRAQAPHSHRPVREARAELQPAVVSPDPEDFGIGHVREAKPRVGSIATPDSGDVFAGRSEGANFSWQLAKVADFVDRKSTRLNSSH